MSGRALSPSERKALDKVIGPDVRGAYRQAEAVWLAAVAYGEECEDDSRSPGSAAWLLDEVERLKRELAEERAAHQRLRETALSLIAADPGMGAGLRDAMDETGQPQASRGEESGLREALENPSRELIRAMWERWRDDGHSFRNLDGTGAVTWGEKAVATLRLALAALAEHPATEQAPRDDLPPELRRLLEDPSVVVRQDQAVWELIAEWQRARPATESSAAAPATKGHQ